MQILDRAWQRYQDHAGPWFLPLAFLVFTASGFAGLIYESIWTHYLKLFLGHAAYAQTLVLAIFMGGMAIGAWLASRLTLRWRNLLLLYAVTEALIGLMSLVFHDVFVSATGWAFESVIPAFGSAGAVYAFKWSLAAGLILPQSILLGMTFPLMTGGVLRVAPERSGYAIAMLYFTNSLGAAIGVLASAFFYIPTVGLPGALAGAAVVNLAAAAGAALLPRRPETSAPAPQPAPVAGGKAPLAPLLLAVAALTGMSSFMYEIGWIRMLALVLGSSTHAFEIMLSAFILGLAFGGFWVRRRIDAASDTVRLLGWVQVAMGIAALATLPVYGETFHAMRWLIGVLNPSASGYAVFNVASHGLALAVMFPAAFCAGMTLPLITATLLRLGAGERAIGQTYAVNTAGAIAGVLIAVHAGLPLLGVKGLIVVAAAIDLVLGVVLLAQSSTPRRIVRLSVATASSVAAVAVAVSVVRLDAHQMASGVFRQGSVLGSDHKVLLHQDGKTATVSVTDSGDNRSLRTNGKPDAMIRMVGPSDKFGDEVTMLLLGALPILLAPDAQAVANIGLGTGMTTHVLLASPNVQSVDTVEIEPAMLSGAELFRPHNRRALDDGRSKIHLEDAKTFFAAAGRRYDVIVSEPSNPWVSGVSSLFTTEFYRDTRGYLREGGLLVQWVQLYEFSPLLLSSVIAALRPHFSDYALWIGNEADLIIVAANGGRVPDIDPRALAFPELAAVMARYGIRSLHDLRSHRLGGKDVLDPYFSATGVEPNSDFFPLLETLAPLARFMRSSATEVLSLVDAPFPVVALLGERSESFRATGLTYAKDAAGDGPRLVNVRHAVAAARFLREGDTRALDEVPSGFTAELMLVRSLLGRCGAVPLPALRVALYEAARVTTVYVPGETAPQWHSLARSECAKRLPSADRKLLELYSAVASARMPDIAKHAQAVLEEDAALPSELNAYALSAVMTAHIASGKPGLARIAYATYRNRLRANPRTWRPVFQLLLGHADRGPAAADAK
jgi:predicted membrane-bound spermidine synthase